MTPSLNNNNQTAKFSECQLIENCPKKSEQIAAVMTICFLHRFWFEWLVEDNDGHVLAAIRHGLGLRWNWLSDYWFRMNACHLHQRFVHKDSESIGLSRVLLSFSIAAPQLRTLKYLCRMRYDEIKTHEIRFKLRMLWRNTYSNIDHRFCPNLLWRLHLWS